MGIFQRGERSAQMVGIAEDMDENIDEARALLRDEPDVDPIVEEATDRLREELRHLVARDEWGRELAWRHVARIALGPVLTKLRDQETTIRLLAATHPGTVPQPEPTADSDLLDALELALEQAPAVELTEAVDVVEQPGPVDEPGTDTPATGAPVTEAPPSPDGFNFRAF